MTFLKATAAASALLLTASAATASTILIDDFDVRQTVEDLPGSNPNEGTASGGSILGGVRFMSVRTSPTDLVTDPGNPQPIAGSSLESTGVSALPSSDTLKFNNDSGQTGVAVVKYGLVAGGAALGDLTMGGVLDKFFF